MKVSLALAFIFFKFILMRYQVCKHLSGSNLKGQSAVYGTTNEYDPRNRIGGVLNANSELLSSLEMIVLYGGRTYENSYPNDEVWKYNLDNNQWKFMKGRKTLKGETSFPEGTITTHVFQENLQIGGREYSRTWMNGDFNDQIIYIFGGDCIEETGFSKRLRENTNEFWRYNVSSNQYSVEYYEIGYSTEFYGAFTSNNHYSVDNIPGGRSHHEIVKFDENEVILVGGIGYGITTPGIRTLADYWFFSTELMQWKFAGGNTESSFFGMTYGETNVYDPSNNIGNTERIKGVKINDEEALFFGGTLYVSGSYTSSNVVTKYNRTGNMWKYVSGDLSVSTKKYSKGLGRTYNISNFPGSRFWHGLWKINENEVLLFGGYGFSLPNNDYTTDMGYLNDQWVFDINKNQWKFTGKERSKYINRYQDMGSFDSTLMGGLMKFAGNYVDERKALIICTGRGFDLYVYEHLEDCWSIYQGNFCNEIADIENNVCNGKGLCVDYDTCECFDGYSGQFCQDLDALVVIIAIISSVAGFSFLIVAILSISALIILCLAKRLKKFDDIEDVDLILAEQKISRDSTIAHFKINKSLFEIDPKDITIEEKIGEGGSSAVVYSGIWNNQKIAYKCFSVQSFLETDKFDEFEKEVELIASLSFPSILTFFGATLSSNRLGFVMEFAENGDLESFLKRYKKKQGRSYPLQEKLRIFYEIGSAMSFLHSKKILHRDLKLQNVLVTGKEEVKLMDFGLSKIIDNELTRTKKVGTSFFMAPEVISGKYSFPCDVYSFAILMFISLTENYSPKFRITGKNIDAHSHPEIKELMKIKAPKEIKEMITKNWNHSPLERMNFREISTKLKKYSRKNRIVQRDNEDNLVKRNQFLEKKIQEFQDENERLKKQLKELSLH